PPVRSGCGGGAGRHLHSSPTRRSSDLIRSAVARALAGRIAASNDETYGMVGRSGAMARLRRLVPLLARSQDTVLVIGETGTGKRSEEHTSELQSPYEPVCRPPHEKKNT